MTDLIVMTKMGLYCPMGDFYVDPCLPVDRAVITHAHSDHAHPGSRAYLCSAKSLAVLRLRFGAEVSINCLEYGEKIRLNEVELSFIPAGHVLGSAQIRLSYKGEVWVVSGDYKLQEDPTCAAFEPVSCNTFITESTFALPVFAWPESSSVAAEINSWWQKNQKLAKTSVLFAYSFGKAQRILSSVDSSIGPIYCHSAVAQMNEAYKETGVSLPVSLPVTDSINLAKLNGALLITPPATKDSSMLDRLNDSSLAFASGWMRIRANRKREGVDKGFVLSDHADWAGLLQAIKSSGAERVIVSHGYEESLSRYLQEQGVESHGFKAQRFDPYQNSSPEDSP